MESLSPIKGHFPEKFKDKRYFNRFFRGRSQDEIVNAIQSLRELRDNINQSQLAELCGMKPSAVSRLEKPEYGRWNFQTLWRIAEALDARWRFILEPRECVIEQYTIRDLSLDSASVAGCSSTFNTNKQREIQAQDSSGQDITGKLDENRDRQRLSPINRSIFKSETMSALVEVGSGGQKVGTFL